MKEDVPYIMTTNEIRETVLTLSESDRANLAALLLDSLPKVLVEADDGLAEAMRRDRELGESGDAGCSWKKVTANLER